MEPSALSLQILGCPAYDLYILTEKKNVELFIENNPITPKIYLHPSQTSRYLNKKYSHDIMKFGAFHIQWIKQISEGVILLSLIK